MDSTDYTADWLKYAIPHQNGQPDSCSRYEYVASVDSSNGTCGTSNFNQSNVVRCDSFVTKNNAETIASHVRTIKASICVINSLKISHFL